MKVKAKHWLNVNGIWHKPGEAFEVDSVAGYGNAVEVIAEAPKREDAPKEEKPVEKPVETVRSAPKRRAKK